jgi:hypothetical protein
MLFVPWQWPMHQQLAALLYKAVTEHAKKGRQV